MKRIGHHQGFTVIETVIVALILVVLLGLALPAASRVKLQGTQMKDLNNGKQIYLGLKLFATDNDGRFPWADYDPATGSPSTSGTSVSNSNSAFQSICPQYVQSRETFYVARSGWTPKIPSQNALTAPLSQPGENAYAYVPGLNVNGEPTLPLVADAFSPIVGAYSIVPGGKGSVWKGKSALVIRIDGSARFQPCDPRTLRVRGDSNEPDLFAPRANWIPQAPVNPL